MKKKIIFLGPLPPPYMGPSLATEVLLNSKLKDEFDLIHLDTSDHRGLETLGAIDFWNIYLPLKFYVILIKLIITKKPDLVYIPISQETLGYLKDSIFIIISKLFRRKVVCHLRGGNFKNWLNRASSATNWYVKKVHSLVDGQIVLGENLKYLFKDLVPEEKIFVVPNGKDITYNPKPDQHNEKIKILYLANMIRTKGVLDVLYAIPQVHAKFPNVEFVFGGDWNEEDVKKEMESYQVKHPNLPIKLLGMVCGKEKYDLLNTADIFVFPTYYPPEGHPWVIVEAMANGLPIITTDHAAISESVVNNINGFLVEKQNPDDIAEKLMILLNNHKLRKTMGQESRKLYQDKFTEEKMVEGISLVFNSVFFKCEK
jgi:glycosyltransferase involved in cell wall biosynthesis